MIYDYFISPRIKCKSLQCGAIETKGKENYNN